MGSHGGCRRVAALHLVPLLSRLILAAAFIPAGWGKVMGTTTVEGPEAAAIRTMLADPWETEADTEDETGSEATPATGETPDESESTATDATTAAPASDADAEAPLEIRRVLRLAVLLDAHDLPMPVVLAWIAAVVELVGGGLLAIGLLSRVWALGLVIAMGVAFTLTSLDPLLASGPFGLDLDVYTKAVAQLALGGLAAGVLLTGPGAVSIDHGIFGGSRSDPLDDDDDDVD